MKKTSFLFLVLSNTIFSFAQSAISPQQMLELNRVAALGFTKDKQSIVYRTVQYDVLNDQRTIKFFVKPLDGGNKKEIVEYESLMNNPKISFDGKYKLSSELIKIQRIEGNELYPELKNANVKVYDDLQYRHWDSWEDGAYGHVIISAVDGKGKALDIMNNEPFDCPQQPFGGEEDYIWSPDGQQVIYVCKKSFGKDYTVSTNTDLYAYDLEKGKTENLTAYNKGYDTAPAFSPKGTLAWLQMKRDGYESDKNDIVIRLKDGDCNLTESWDGTVNAFVWSEKGDKIYFVAPIDGTVQLFETTVPKNKKAFIANIKQLTQGEFDVHGVLGQSGQKLVVSRRDMNHASEIYLFNLKNGDLKPFTDENKDMYDQVKMSKIERRYIKTTDNKKMLTWVIYPPDFDPDKKYPTLLYCQGGPQGALSQFYSFRWNFQVMAAQGYIIVAPNRRGMPGHGVAWNEQISGDYGGQNMKDYLSAIDALVEEPYVDKERLGCIGASYGGYSCFYLAGIHEKRFKSFIAHDGIFNWRSMYGTTEEMFFVNWDLGGNYWDKSNKIAQRSFNEFNPVNQVDSWDTPILIIQGGKDFRVPIGQGLEAFNAAQLRGIKSRLLFFPEENHWVLSPQNALVWQNEFFKWLEETLD